MHKTLATIASLPLIITFNLHASDYTSADAFKAFLSHPLPIREVTWRESFSGKPGGTAYYTGASDGHNYFIRRFLPTNNIHLKLSPSNTLGIPFFVGRDGKKRWEITGTLMINETQEKSSPLFQHIQNGRMILERALMFGIPDVAIGKVKWNNDRFVVPKWGMVPSKITIIDPKTKLRYTISRNADGTISTSGSSEVTNGLPFPPSLVNSFGAIYVTNGYVRKLDCDTVSIHYTYENKSLPIGVPSGIYLYARGALQQNCIMAMQILRFVVDTNLSRTYFAPTNFIVPKYTGINQVYTNGSETTRNNTYLLSLSQMKRSPTLSSKWRRAVVYSIFVVITVPFIAFICYKRKSKSRTNP